MKGLDRLKEMFDALSSARKEVLPSKFWVELKRRNLEQLEKHGYENFKRTIALYYFTWLVSPTKNEQMIYLGRNLPVTAIVGNVMRALCIKRHECFSWKQSFRYNLITYMLWEYVSRNGNQHLLYKLHEPIEGNPPPVYLRGKLISQDLANSVLEFNSIINSVDKNSIKTVMELGAGYGRTAFVFLSLMPEVKYIIVDIPPALFVSERYLSNQFPQKKVFKFREFNNYSEIREELDSSDIAFFLPSQLDMLPGKIVDLFINISSLHEMRPDQIEYYFSSIDRLTRSYFYFKQWKVSKNSFDNITVKESDYPIRRHWSQIYWRECKVQTLFFEALFRL